MSILSQLFTRKFSSFHRPFMKLRPSFIIGLALLGSLSAVTLPVSEDSSSAAKAGGGQAKLTAAAGTAKTLPISSTRSAFLRFEAGSLAGDFPAEQVDRALLMIYFSKVTRAGAIRLNAVSGDWTEAPAAIVPAPGVSVTPIATIPAESAIGSQFAIVDVTSQVRAWMEDPSSDNGLALVGDDAVVAEIGAKEGPGAGYPAVLQIERKAVVGDSQIAPGIDATKVGSGVVDNTELGYLDGVTSVIQPQLNQLDAGVDEVRTGLGEKVNKSGDTMTGPLVLPSLQVQGEVKLGPELHAAGGDESLRIVRGVIALQDGVLTLVSGKGFEFTQPSGGNTGPTITFSQAFSSPPAVHVQQEVTPGSTNDLGSNPLRAVTASEITLRYVANPLFNGTRIHFIAIGPC
jgi:hypothetical protein